MVQRYYFGTKVRLDLAFALRLRSSLQIVAVEHEVRFSKLHAKRAEVIANLYGLLWEARSLAAQLIFQGARDVEQSDKAREKVFELYRFINLNRIYLPKSACTLLDNFESKLRKSVIFVDVYWTRIVPANPETREQANKAILDVGLLNPNYRRCSKN
jgi:hypothetical protein